MNSDMGPQQCLGSRRENMNEQNTYFVGNLHARCETHSSQALSLGISICGFSNICIDLHLLSGARLCGLFFNDWDQLGEHIQLTLQWKISEAKKLRINFHQKREWWCVRVCTGSINQSHGRKNSAEARLKLQQYRRSLRRNNFTKHPNCDLWDTLGGRIQFCSEENMNKVTVQDHKMRIYWVHLDMCETAAAECLRWLSVGPHIIHNLKATGGLEIMSAPSPCFRSTILQRSRKKSGNSDPGWTDLI